MLERTLRVPLAPFRSKGNKCNKHFLPSTFSPGEWDIICHHGKDPRDHAGNRRFKPCIEAYISTYLAAHSRSSRSAVISEIVRAIRSSSMQAGGVGFVRYDPSTKLWYEVREKVARDKVGHSLREAIRAKESKQEETEEDHQSKKLTSNSSASVPGEVLVWMDKCLGYAAPTSSLYDALAMSEVDGVLFGEGTSAGESSACTTAMDLCDWFEAEMQAI